MMINLEFSGGMELLFDNKARMQINVENIADIRALLPFIRDSLLTGKSDLFMSGDSMY